MIESELCPCGSGKKYGECCAPIIACDAQAGTAEALMRARYSAYVAHEIDFIVSSCDHSDKEQEIDYNQTKKWSEESDWRSLKILRTEGGGADDSKGIVEFQAEYVDKNGRRQIHHEIGEFEKVGGRWLYVRGTFPKVEQVVREGAKIGRNDPCPCGSGKKYKRCCGR